jgi:hypothetical protein
MYRLSKCYPLCLVAILAFSVLLIIAETTGAQTIPKPTVPEFTVQLVDNSYDVPAIQTIDPYTGEKITQPSHHVENKTIELKIANQRNDYTIYYSVKMKGHFEENWTSIYSTWNRMKQSDSQFTIFNFYPSVARDGGQIDFQVEAAAGYWTQGDVIVPGAPRGDVFIGEKSGWSSTQTLTIPSASASASPSPTVPEFPYGAVLSLFALVPLIAIVVKKRICLKSL